MNSEQLNSARLARWSQNGEARLTLEAVSDWVGTIGFCPYLPPGPNGTAPSASFVEAVVGRPARIPSAGERTRAQELLVRVIENSVAVPLKFGSLPGEQPESIASPEVFRFVYALRGDRNFKTDPSTVGNEKVTPLALHCWQSIKKHGPLDLPALQSILGRDMTEAAIARALQELWAGLHVCPVPRAKGQPAQWEMLSRRFPQQVAAGAATGHAESLSAMVSLYLYAVVAATEDEILAFLSPLAAQSKLREVIRGLGAMRQLEMIDVAGRAHLALQGGLLPEMVAQLSEEQLSPAPLDGVDAGGIEIEREPVEQRATRPGSYTDSGQQRKFVPKKFVPRKFAAADSKPRDAAPKRFNMQASGERSGPGTKSKFSRPALRGDTARPGRFGFAGREARNSAGDQRPGSKTADHGPGERARRWEKAGERPDSRSQDRDPAPRPGFKSSGFKPAGSKPWARKAAGPRDESAKPWSARKSFAAGAPPRHSADGEGERSQGWKKSGAGPAAKPSGARPYAKSFGSKPGGAKSWARKTGDRAGGERSREDRRQPFGAAGSGEKSADRKSYGARSTRPSKPWESRGRTGAGEGRPGSRRWEKSAPSASEGPAARKQYGAKSPGFKSGGGKPWASRGAESRVGSAKSYAARKGGKLADAKPWAERSPKPRDGRERPPRREESATGGGGKPGGAKPYGSSGAKPFWAKNPRGGKGSSAASRTNRPRGGKSGGKKK